MLQRLFGFNRHKMTLRTEIIAGITTFLTMAYILAVNPNIMSATGMDRGALFTTTAVSAAFATLMMAFYGKMPLGLAPGMGLNAFFAYTMCLTLGYTWQFALTAVFIEGILFILLTLSGWREKIVEALPNAVRTAIAPGIGCFIAFIGLQNAGIIVNNDATLVSLGDVSQPSVLLAVVGIVLSAALLIHKVKGALLIGIVAATLLGIPLGVTHFEGIVSMPPSPESIVMQFEWSSIFSVKMAIAVFTFLFIDMFDTIGTLLGVSENIATKDGDKTPINLRRAFMADALGTTVGAMLGSSTVTTYVESTSGVSEGGRSGVTAFVIAMLFAVSLFLSPLFLSVPSSATAPALILVGVMMAAPMAKINFNDYSDSIPAFLTIIMMPLAYSISDGIVMGLLSYVILNLVSGRKNRINVAMIILAVIFIFRFMI